MNQIIIKYVDASKLVVPEWRATYILRPDLLVLSASLNEFGFIEPIHIRKETNEIIDGSERYLLATKNEQIKSVVGKTIPVIEHDIDSLTAMMLHLRLNRGRGLLVAKQMSKIIRNLKRSKKYDKTDFDNLLCMKQVELDLMLEPSILKHKKIHEHTYSRAWVPVEAPSAEKVETLSLERPPNADR